MLENALPEVAESGIDVARRLLQLPGARAPKSNAQNRTPSHGAGGCVMLSDLQEAARVLYPHQVAL